MKKLPPLSDLAPRDKPRGPSQPQTAAEIDLTMRRWRIAMAFAEPQPSRGRP